MCCDYSCLCMLECRKEIVVGIAARCKFRVCLPCLCCGHCIDRINSARLDCFAENARKQFFLCRCPSGVISTVSTRRLQSAANDANCDLAIAEKYFVVKRKMMCMHAQSYFYSIGLLEAYWALLVGPRTFFQYCWAQRTRYSRSLGEDDSLLTHSLHQQWTQNISTKHTRYYLVCTSKELGLRSYVPGHIYQQIIIPGTWYQPCSRSKA